MRPKTKHLLLIILLLATVLRFYNFASQDVYTDEVLIGIRAIGMVDFSASSVQTSPWQWVNEVPSWMHLSMHDHPILGFFIPNIFFKIFGLNTIGLRLACVLAGILSVYILYLIGKKLFNEKVGLIAAFILSINPYHLWVSRVGLQESILILFILLAFYFFLKSLLDKKYILATWTLFGICILTKLTAIILLPIFFVIIIYKKQLKEFLFSKYFWWGVLIFIIIISPLVIYNIKMMQTYGHLDFQLSGAAGQDVEQWQVRYGRELAGDLQTKIYTMPGRIKQGLSWPAFLIFIIAYFALIWKWLKTKKTTLFILLITILAWLLFYFIIGPTRRFMSYVMPFVALVVAWFTFNVILSESRRFSRDEPKDPANNGKGKLKKIKITILVILILFELFFTINTFYTFRPIGPKGITWSHANNEFRSWGFHNLDEYLDKLLKNKMPYASFPAKHKFLQKILDRNLEKMENKNYESLPALFIYDANIFDLAALWLYHRRAIYQGWPILDAKTYIDTIQTEGSDYFQKIGIKQTYLISPTPNAYLEYKKPLTNWGFELETILKDQNIEPKIIYNDSDQAVFKIYSF